jgi:hypothetical protein
MKIINTIRTNSVAALLISSVGAAALSWAITSLTAGYFYKEKINKQNQSIQSYLDSTKKMERVVVERAPIYSDYINPEIIKSFRTYLLKYHLEETEKSGMPRITKDSEVESLIQSGKLVKLEQKSDTPYFFYNVPEKYRALTPQAKAALDSITQRISEKLGALKSNSGSAAPGLKIAISSAVRPSAYQENLKGKNANAANESSHSYGISFDIFYDEYYTIFPELKTEDSSEATLKMQSDLRRRLGFLSGAALARQYQSLLSKALLELQEEEKIYVIIEHNQRVYHVSVRH